MKSAKIKDAGPALEQTMDLIANVAADFPDGTFDGLEDGEHCYMQSR